MIHKLKEIRKMRFLEKTAKVYLLRIMYVMRFLFLTI